MNNLIICDNYAVTISTVGMIRQYDYRTDTYKEIGFKNADESLDAFIERNSKSLKKI